MGTRYSNLTLQDVQQEELINYLSEICLDAYVSPTINGFTVLYDLATLGYSQKLPKFLLDSTFNALIRQYRNAQQAAIACLSSHLSKKFNCSILAVFVIDSLTLWYHLSLNGQMVDEYITCGDKHWKPGQAIMDFGEEIKGGDAEKLCSAFGREDVITEVTTILKKPIWSPKEQKDGYDSMMRHEALARALGIKPCWVVGINYLCCNGHDDFEAHYEGNCEKDDPPYEEAIAQIKATFSTSPSPVEKSFY